VRIKLAPREGWEEKATRLRRRQRGWGKGGEDAPRLGRRRQGWGNGEENLREKCVREKWYPISLEIPNIKSRDILSRLRTPNPRSIWLNFTKFSSKFTRASRGGYYDGWKVPTQRNMGYISRLTPPNRCSIFNAFKFWIFTFFSFFYVGYEWQPT